MNISSNYKLYNSYNNYMNTSALFSNASKSSNANITNAVLGGSSFLAGTNNMADLTNSVIGGSKGTSVLTDYALVKSGSYGKLLKAYYASAADETKVSKVSEEESSKNETGAVYDEKGSKATQIETSKLYDIFV
jgi:hypothetical protein